VVFTRKGRDLPVLGKRFSEGGKGEQKKKDAEVKGKEGVRVWINEQTADRIQRLKIEKGENKSSRGNRNKKRVKDKIQKRNSGDRKRKERVKAGLGGNGEQVPWREK